MKLFLVSLLSIMSMSFVQAQNDQKGEVIQPVEDQLTAYNNRDIDAFLRPYSDSIKVYNFGGQLQYIGKEIMRQNYADWFEQTPDLYCNLLNRIVLGNTIIDHEEITTDKNKPTWQAVAIYKVKDGKIDQVTFVMDN